MPSRPAKNGPAFKPDFHAQRKCAQGGLDFGEVGHGLLHVPAGDQGRHCARLIAIGEIDQQCIAAELEHVAAILEDDAQHTLKIAVDDLGDLLSPLTAHRAEFFRKRRKAADVGKGQCAAQKLTTD